VVESGRADATSDRDLRSRFDRAMQDVDVLAKKEAGYNATYYLDMLHRYGGLETARWLLASGTDSDGFVALWERGRLDLTVRTWCSARSLSPSSLKRSVRPGGRDSRTTVSMSAEKPSP
jgi:hypothetical protein